MNQDCHMEKNFQKIRVKISPEESFKFRKLKFNAICLTNYVTFLLRNAQGWDVDNLEKQFKNYSDKLIAANTELLEYQEQLAYKYSSNITSQICNINLTYNILPQEQEIIYTYEI